MRVVVLVVALGWSGAALAQQGSNPSFNLMNRSAQAIVEVYATPVGMGRWGPDRLTRYLVAPGQVFPLRLPGNGACLYDLRVVYADGHPEERRRVNTCEMDAIAFPGRNAAPVLPAPALPGTQATDDPSFRLVNQARIEVARVFASPSGDGDWGLNRLGDGAIAAGATRVIRLPRGECTYDVRVVYGNGQAVERRRVNLCEVTDLRLP